MALSACSPSPQTEGAGIVLAPNSAPPSIKQTELFEIFLRTPYDASKRPEQQYPRAALRVLRVPPNMQGYDSSKGFVEPGDGCYLFDGLLWRDRTTAERLDPFELCLPRDVVVGIPLANVHDWAGRGALALTNAAGRMTTEGERTFGPLPPFTAMPDDFQHERFWGIFGPTNRDSQVAWMMRNLVANTGLDFNNFRDRRLWVVGFVQSGAPYVQTIPENPGAVGAATGVATSAAPCNEPIVAFATVSPGMTLVEVSDQLRCNATRVPNAEGALPGSETYRWVDTRNTQLDIDFIDGRVATYRQRNLSVPQFGVYGGGVPGGVPTLPPGAAIPGTTGG